LKFPGWRSSVHALLPAFSPHDLRHRGASRSCTSAASPGLGSASMSASATWPWPRTPTRMCWWTRPSWTTRNCWP